MSKSIHEEALDIINEALEKLKELEVILYYDVSKIKTALKLGKLYKKLSFAWEERFDYTNGEQRIRDLQKQIKELVNDK